MVYNNGDLDCTMCISVLYIILWLTFIYTPLCLPTYSMMYDDVRRCVVAVFNIWFRIRNITTCIIYTTTTNRKQCHACTVRILKYVLHIACTIIAEERRIYCLTLPANSFFLFFTLSLSLSLFFFHFRKARKPYCISVRQQ